MMTEELIELQNRSEQSEQSLDKTIPDRLDYEFYIKWFEGDDPTLFGPSQKAIISLGLNPSDRSPSLIIKDKIYHQGELMNKHVAKMGLDKNNILPSKLVEIAFQYEINFPKMISDAYSTVFGKNLKYEVSSPVYQLYDEWTLRPLVTLQEGICLVHGMNPEVSYRGYEKKIYSENPLFPIDRKQYKKSYDLAVSCVEGGTLRPSDKVSRGYAISMKFELDVFIQWAIKCKRNPHQLLLNTAGLSELSILESKGNNVCVGSKGAISRQQFLNELSFFADKKKWNDLHFLFGQVYLELLLETKSIPKAGDVWNTLQNKFKHENSGDISIINKIDSNIINWTSKASYAEPDFRRSSLDDVITEIKKSVVKSLVEFIA